MADSKLSKSEYEKLADFRFRLRKFLRFSEEAAKRKGITMLQYLLMLQIKGYPDRDWATVGELTERLQAKQHGVVALVTRCEEAGLVQRYPGDVDRRQVIVRLTPKGDRLVAKLAKLHSVELSSRQGRLKLPALDIEGLSGDD